MIDEDRRKEYKLFSLNNFKDGECDRWTYGSMEVKKQQSYRRCWCGWWKQVSNKRGSDDRWGLEIDLEVVNTVVQRTCTDTGTGALRRTIARWTKVNVERETLDNGYGNATDKQKSNQRNVLRHESVLKAGLAVRN